MPVLSHPNSKLAVLAGSQVFETTVYCLAGLGIKEVGELTRGYYPIPEVGLYDNEISKGFLFNSDSGKKERAYFRHVDGLPILEYCYQYWEGNVQINTNEFVWNNIFYQVFKVAKVTQSQTVNVLETFQFYVNPVSGRVEAAGGGYPPIVVVAYSDYWFAATCTSMNEYYVDDIWQDPTTGAFDETKNQTSNETTNIGIGKNSIPNGDVVVFVIAWSETSEADAISKAKDALDNWASYKEQSETYWVSKVKSVEPLQPSLRYNAAIALTQILAQSYEDGFLVAGFPTWRDNFVRDTAWSAMGLTHFLPEDARNLLNWWHDISNFTTGNNWKSNKVQHGISNCTDYGAAFLIAVGEYYDITKDLTLIVSLYDRIIDLLDWAKSKYVPADKHIQAPHPHDYWDDYTRLAYISKKYESFIDVYWAEALRRAAVYLKAYGDNDNASWCSETSKALKEGLEDYRMPDGGFWYCIDADGKVVRELTSSASLFAAMFFNDEDAWSWLLKNEQFFDLDTLDPPVICQFEPADIPAVNDAWSPYSALSSAMLISRGNAWATLRDFLETSVLGVLKEGGASFGGHFVYGGGGAPSFPWTYGCLLYGLSNLREGSTTYTKFLDAYGEIISVKRNLPEEQDELGSWVANWLDIGNENVLIQVFDEKQRMPVPGVFLSADAKGFSKPSTAIKTGDRLVSQKGTFEVGNVKPLLIRERIHHLEAELMRVIE